jgi:hypothetical protein
MTYQKENCVGAAVLSVENNGLHAVLQPFGIVCADSESAEHPIAENSILSC